MFSLAFACEPAVETLIFLIIFFFEYYSMLRFILKGLRYSPVTLWHSLDYVPCLEDSWHHHSPSSPLALWRKVVWPCKLKPWKDHAIQFSVGGHVSGHQQKCRRQLLVRHGRGATWGLSWLAFICSIHLFLPNCFQDWKPEMNLKEQKGR